MSMDSVPKIEKKIKGDQKSLEIENVGKVEYSEHFIEMFDASRKRMGLEAIEGFKVKKILSLPPALEEKFKAIEEEITSKYGDLRLNKAKDDPEKTSVTQSLAAVSEKLRGLEYKEKRETFEQMLRIEYELTEGRTPSMGTVQHALGAGAGLQLLGEWKKDGLLFSPY